MKGRKRRNGVLTTGELAKVCHVAPRTAAKWIDSGRVRGFRLPGSADRRVSDAEAARFLRASGMDVPAWLDGPRVLLAACPCGGAWLPAVPGWAVRHAPDLFAAGLACVPAPDAALFDLCLGRAACLRAAAGLAALEYPPRLIALAYDDESDPEALRALFALVLYGPDAAAVAAFLSGEGGTT